MIGGRFLYHCSGPSSAMSRRSRAEKSRGAAHTPHRSTGTAQAPQGGGRGLLGRPHARCLVCWVCHHRDLMLALLHVNAVGLQALVMAMPLLENAEASSAIGRRTAILTTAAAIVNNILSAWADDASKATNGGRAAHWMISEAVRCDSGCRWWQRHSTRIGQLTNHYVLTAACKLPAATWRTTAPSTVRVGQLDAADGDAYSSILSPLAEARRRNMAHTIEGGIKRHERLLAAFWSCGEHQSSWREAGMLWL